MTNDAVTISNRDELLHALGVLLQQDAYRLDFFTWRMLPGMLDEQHTLEEMRQTAIKHRHSLIRLLTTDSKSACQDHHKMIPLIHKLPSKIQARQPDRQLELPDSYFVIADSCHLLQWSDDKRPEGKLHLNNKKLASIWQEKFDHLWEKSHPDKNLRQLAI